MIDDAKLATAFTILSSLIAGYMQYPDPQVLDDLIEALDEVAHRALIRLNETEKNG
jgi:hypothetical protein